MKVEIDDPFCWVSVRHVGGIGHESQTELWSSSLTTDLFVGFGTDRFRRQGAMKTAGSENPNHPTPLLHQPGLPLLKWAKNRIR